MNDEMTNNQLKARIFISCGQASEEEHQIVQEIQNKIEQLGFEEPYVAINEQDLGGIKENILYENLEKSEYFIFIDFIREKIDENAETKEKIYRGSLFTNQELAIASYLKKPVCAFQEKGVKPLDGILQCIQANCITFNSRKDLPKLVVQEIQNKLRQSEWNNNWRDEIIFNRVNAEFDNAFDLRFKKDARWYHIEVINQHWKEIARDCVAYLEWIELPDGKKKSFELVELKWKGVITQRVSIPPKGVRHLDAFHIYFDSPNTAFLAINQFIIDTSKYSDEYLLTGAGDYKLHFIVFSNNFSPIRRTFYLRLGNSLGDILFTEKQDELKNPIRAENTSDIRAYHISGQ